LLGVITGASEHVARALVRVVQGHARMLEDPPAKIEHFSSVTLPTASPVGRSGKETNCTHSALAAANALTKAPKLVVGQQQSDVILLLIRPS